MAEAMKRYTDGNKYMKRFSTALAIREMQIKATTRYHYIPIRKAKIKNRDNTKGW